MDSFFSRGTESRKGIDSGFNSFSRVLKGPDTQRNDEELFLELLPEEAGVTKGINFGINLGITEAHADLYPRTKN